MKLRISLLLLSVFLSGMLAAQGFTLTLKVKAVTGEGVANTPVVLEHLDYGILYPAVYLSEKGECVIKNVMEGKNQLTISKTGLAIFKEELIISKDSTISVTLQEAIRTPYALQVKNIHNVRTGQNDLLLGWNKETDYFFDDFESYDAFSISFSPWTGIDFDKAPAARLSGAYPNSELPQYATIFNPLTISPPVWYEYPVLRPYSGKQYAAFIRTASGTANNDWLISPKIKVGVGNIVRFMAKAGDKYREQFKVGISTTGTEANDFRFLTPGNYEDVDYREWKTVQYDLSDYEGKDVYIAIQYISQSYFMLMVDDFYVGPKNVESLKLAKRMRSDANPSEKFVVYCDNDSIDTVENPPYLFKNVKGGAHILGVKAKYKISQSAISTINATVNDASFYAGIKIKVTANNSLSTDSFMVNYMNRNTGEQYSEMVLKGVSELKSLPKGDYLINIAPEGYEAYNHTVTIDKDITLDVQLKEIITTPYNVTSDLTVNQDGTMDVLLKWNQDLGFTDGFESYPDFSQTFGDWTTVDVDKMPPYGVSIGTTEISFPGAKEPSACMVFNAKTTTPSMEDDGAIRAPEGDKSIIFFSAQSGQSNDWLISPLQKIADKYVVRFVAKSYTSVYSESCEIAISDEKDISTFQVLDEITLPDAWTVYEVDLSEYAGKSKYIAIRYKSNDKFMMLMDSFYVGPGEDIGGTTSRNATFEISLNGVKKASVRENYYQFNNLSEGKYTVGIKAVYASGSSETVEHSFSASSIENSFRNENIRVISGKQEINVTLSVEEELTIQINDATGKVLYNIQTVGKNNSFTVVPGVYIVVLNNGVQQNHYKVLVR